MASVGTDPDTEKVPSEDDVGDIADDTASITEKASATERPNRGRIQFGIGQLITGLVIVALAVAVSVLGYLLADSRSQNDAMRADAADASKAEQVALDYATGAAQMDYNDLGAWNKRLTANTSPELTKKLSDASSAMEQVIVPLQWTSTATPIAAQVKSHNGSVYVVTAFVSVMTKNAQAPNGVASTASYTVTMDRSKNWLITDVGGLDSAVAPPK